jgi:hypothetical protein
VEERSEVAFFILFTTALVIYPTAIFMRKNHCLSDLYATVLFSSCFQCLVDAYAGFRFKAWGLFIPDEVEFKSLSVILGIYPIFALLIVNWFPYRKSFAVKLGYLLAWTFFSTAYEWVCLKAGIIWHQNWNLLYSFLIYPVIYYAISYHMRFFQWLKKFS